MPVKQPERNGQDQADDPRQVHKRCLALAEAEDLVRDSQTLRLKIHGRKDDSTHDGDSADDGLSEEEPDRSAEHGPRKSAKVRDVISFVLLKTSEACGSFHQNDLSLQHDAGSTLLGP